MRVGLNENKINKIIYALVHRNLKQNNNLLAPHKNIAIIRVNM